MEQFSHRHVNLYPSLSESERAALDIPPPPVLMVDGEKMEEEEEPEAYEWDLAGVPMEKLKI